jgi:hypothetical protein
VSDGIGHALPVRQRRVHLEGHDTVRPAEFVAGTADSLESRPVPHLLHGAQDDVPLEHRQPVHVGVAHLAFASVECADERCAGFWPGPVLPRGLVVVKFDLLDVIDSHRVPLG